MSQAESLSLRRRFAAAVQAELRRRRLTQTEAAELLGVPQTNVSRLVRAAQSIGLDHAERIADRLDLDIRIVRRRASRR